MSQLFSGLTRSQLMARIRSRGNKNTELALIKVFRLHRITGWRRNHPVFGRPDFVFPHFKLAIFVDGCFWHGCKKHTSHVKKSGSFWQNKLKSNRKRDRLVNSTLRKSGWKVLRIWEHELARKNELRLLRRLDRALANTRRR